MEIKLILSILAILFSIFGYSMYYRDILSGKTKPHIFSWFGWMIMEAIAFGAIIVGGGAAGAWPHLTSALICLGIVILSLKYGEKNITKLDFFCITLSMLAIVLWQATSNPLFAVILVTLADALAYVPTFRKAFYKPYEETMITFILSEVKQLLILFALHTYSPTTIIFDLYLITANTAFVIMLIVRRRKIKDPAKK